MGLSAPGPLAMLPLRSGAPNQKVVSDCACNAAGIKPITTAQMIWENHFFIYLNTVMNPAIFFLPFLGSMM
jgi:hypothetical protein